MPRSGAFQFAANAASIEAAALPAPSTSAGRRSYSPSTGGGERASKRALELVRGGGSRRRHYQRPARSSSVATAGSFLPSRNSRNAPPPVEMYEMSPPTPNCSIAASVSPPPAIENASLDATAAATRL